MQDESLYDVMVVDTRADIDMWGNFQLRPFNKHPMTKRQADSLAVNLIGWQGLRSVAIVSRTRR